MIEVDFIGLLPKIKKGNKYIIVAIDYLIKWFEARAVRKADARVTADFIYEDIICRHRCSRKILSDNRTHFKNEFIKELTDKFHIKYLFLTPYYSQTNGLIERHNRTICESIAKSLTDIQNWNEVLNSVLFAHRSAIQSTIKITPFYLIYDRSVQLPFDKEYHEISLSLLSDRINELMDDLSILRKKAK